MSDTESEFLLGAHMFKKYLYVGPEDIRKTSEELPSGTPIRIVADLTCWLSAASTDGTVDRDQVFTFTIGGDEVIYLAPRRSEHVACASGGPVLSAGEITLDPELKVLEISNLSTGFCPEPESWLAVENALNRIGLEHPGEFTTAVTFRFCDTCRARNIVKDAWFFCDLCDAELPQGWNF